MASSKHANMVTRTTHDLFTVLAYAVLEWVLILFLLINSLLSYFIRRFAAYFGLEPPCPWCSRLDHGLLEPAKSSHPYKTMICEVHAKEISNLTYCSSHRKLAESKSLCEECLLSKPGFHGDQNLGIIKCSCCGKVLGRKENENEGGNQSGSDCEHQIISDFGSFCIREVADEDSNEEDEISGNNHEIRACDSLTDDQKDTLTGQSKEIEAEGDDDDDDDSSTIQRLRSDLEAERKARHDLYSELEAERNAAAIAANQTLAMITRLQQEKAAMQMEALQYQRLMEEQAEYDQQALQLLNELVSKREREKLELEKELDVYRERVSDYEEKDKARMMIHKCKDLRSSSNLDTDSDVLSIDLNLGYEKGDDEEEERRDVSLLECSKEWGAIDDSLEELEEERFSIMKQLRELEEKLIVVHESEEEEGKIKECQKNPNSDSLCSQEVNLGSFSFAENRPKTMASVARSLLDLVDSSRSETEDDGENGCDQELAVCQVENESKRLAIEKEMDHVYHRLQALEADTEFLRHCIGSVTKGNHGANVLQEILEHLRDLRASEICF